MVLVYSSMRLTSAEESAWSQLDNFLGVALEGV